MKKFKRGFKVAAVVLSFLTVTIAGANAQTTDCGCNACNAPTQVAYTQPTPVYTASVSTCGCASCRKKVACPQCDCQFCELDVKKGEVEKTCFKTEQKEVCIPAVRLPWKKNCPPTRSKVRTVNVLKKHKYKCPKCQYKWNVHEPEDFEKPEAAEKEEAGEKKAVAKENAAESNASELTPEELKEFDLKPGEKIISVFSDPSEALGSVPQPPVE